MFRLSEHMLPKSLRDVRTKAVAFTFVMCEQTIMSDKPGTMELSKAVGISKGHASDILNDASERQPSRALAIHIYRTTGWKHSCIAELTDAQIEILEQVEPWTKAA